MKENRAANSLGDGGESEKISKTTKIGAYVAIALLLFFIVWVNVAQPSLPRVEVDKIASITSWYGGATSTDKISFFNREKMSDLSVEILEVGVINGEEFIPNDTLTSSSVGALRVKVINQGKATSGEWKLRIEFPTRIPYSFTSGSQRPLEKNELRTFTFTFDKLKTGADQRLVVLVNQEEKEYELDNNMSKRNINIY